VSFNGLKYSHQKKLKAMSTYERQKLVEVVLYILNKTGGLDYYHLFKVMYFAEREHLASWGDRITADEFHALPHGPVPTLLYDAIKKKERDADPDRATGRQPGDFYLPERKKKVKRKL
jgi:uncharacterized phage-associated protein